MNEVNKPTNRKTVNYEQRKRVSEKLTRKWQDPEYREKAIKATREGIANKRRRLHYDAGQERL